MPQFRIHKAYYAPGGEVVTIAVEALDGPFAGQVRDLYTTQQNLSDLTVITREIAAPDENWGDAEIELEAATQLTALGAELVTPAPEEEA